MQISVAGKGLMHDDKGTVESAQQHKNEVDSNSTLHYPPAPYPPLTCRVAPRVWCRWTFECCFAFDELASHVY